MNQTQKAAPSWPNPSAPRLHSVGVSDNEQRQLARRGSGAVLVGGLRAVDWEVARLDASSVVLVAVGSRLSVTARVIIRWRS